VGSCFNILSICDNNLIRWEEGNDIVVNGKEVLFGDLFVIREMLYDSEISNILMITQDKWVRVRVRVIVILGKQVKSDLNFHGKTLIQLFHVY